VKIKGIIAVKVNLKYISHGFITSTSSPKPDPVYYLVIQKAKLYYYKFK
jgi:hypothetical protein